MEIMMGSAFAFCAVYFSESLGRMIIAQLLCFYAFTISLIDYRHRIIPDELSLSLAAIGLFISPVNPLLSGGWPGIVESILSFLVGGGLLLLVAWLGEKIFKKEALGGGDVKLVAALGAILGPYGLFASLLIGSLAGGIVGLALILIGQKKLGETIPFGPFLCLGMLMACFLRMDEAFLVFP